jgi:dTDP-4-dehydrorhamnose 3,5-epimerase
MFTVKETRLRGCVAVQPRLFNDERGRFVKVFNEDEFRKLGLETDFKEEFYSQSKRGVIRGMHFQVPPSDHVKLVYCVHGEALDVVLDLRRGSPTYGQADATLLSAERGNYLYIPKGIAHGFCSVSAIATLVYKVSTVHDPRSDTGILWNSFGFDWPVSEPIISARDSNFKSLSEFDSPFVYGQ